MRPIKFRGKIPKTGAWISGFYFQEKGRHYIKQEYTGDELGVWYANTQPVDPSTVSQYTGRDDDFGTPIYEGDIVDNDASAKELVKFYIHDDQQGYTMDLDSPLKVVGNKWDNPDIKYYEHIDKYNPKL